MAERRGIRIGGLLGLGIIGLLLWFAIEMARPRARWLAVEAPSRIPVGQVFPVHVRLLSPGESGYLDVDWHGSTSARDNLGFQAAGGSQRLNPSLTNLEFSIRLPDRRELAYVRGVVFLSRTGRWSDRTRVAETEELRIVRGPAPGVGEGASLRRLAVHTPDSRPPPPVPVVRGVRTATTGFLMLGAVLAGLRRVGERRGGRSGRGWGWLALALGASAGWESFGLGEVVMQNFRVAALMHGLYGHRELPQRIVTVSLATAALACGAAIARARWSVSTRVSALGWILWGAVAVLSALSLHAVDQLAACRLLGVPALQTVRLAGAATGALALLGVVSRNQFSKSSRS